MGWTTPATWAVGEAPTAAKMNTHVRDNLAWIYGESPVCALYADAAQTIPNATWTTLAFDDGSENYDNTNMHDTTTDNGRITINRAGRYIVTGTVAFESTAAGQELGLRVRINGSVAIAEVRCGGINRDGVGLSLCFIRNSDAAEYYELQTIQETGGDHDTYIAGLGVTFGAAWL